MPAVVHHNICLKYLHILDVTGSGNYDNDESNYKIIIIIIYYN
jgi:hypothetical protein